MNQYEPIGRSQSGSAKVYDPAYNVGLSGTLGAQAQQLKPPNQPSPINGLLLEISDALDWHHKTIGLLAERLEGVSTPPEPSAENSKGDQGRGPCSRVHGDLASTLAQIQRATQAIDYIISHLEV